MRILFCDHEYPPLGGGGGVINALIAQEMAKRHEVTILTSQGLDLPAESIEKGVRIIRVPVLFLRQKALANILSMSMFILMGIKTGKKLLSANRYDIINTYFVLPTGPVGDALSRFAGIPNVLSVLGGDLYDPSKFTSPHRHPLLRAWIRRLLRRADLVVGDSTDVLENMRRFYTPEIEGIRIPLGIQKPKVSSASRKQYGLEEDEVLLVTIGRLVPRKAIAQLISIMDVLRKEKEKMRLLIVGTGPQENLLKKEAQRRQLGNRILFLGHVEESEKFRILKMCDIYVSTSQHEGFGLVFLEAMASGLPIVCYDKGGQRDFLKDNETGYLVQLNNLNLFKERCQLLIENTCLRKTIGERNKCRAEQFYIDTCASRYESVFNKVLEKNSSQKRAM